MHGRNGRAWTLQHEASNQVTHTVFSLRLFLGALCLLATPIASGADRVRVLAEGSERSTNAQIVRGIAMLIAKPAGIEVDMRQSAGPLNTLVRLREGSGQQFALLQADLAEAYLGAAARGSIEASQLLAPIRVIAPLHEEDIYFMVRSNSPLNFVHEIEGTRINVGVLNGSTALTVSMLYRLMFNVPIPEQQTSFHSHQDALVKLTEEAVDVVAFVSPDPARLLADMRPEARRFVKLLKFDANYPGARRVFNIYSAKTIPAASYPNLLDDDLPTLAVKIYLVSHGRNDALQARFANAWCQYLPRLRDQGPPALQGLDLALPPLVSGWHYSRPFERELRACIEGKRTPAESCPQEDRVLGLCS